MQTRLKSFADIKGNGHRDCSSLPHKTIYIQWPVEVRSVVAIGHFDRGRNSSASEVCLLQSRKSGHLLK